MADRAEPRQTGSETDQLLDFLAYQRATLRRKVAGLDAEQAGRTVGPSTMTLAGLVSHLDFVEDWWFSVVLAGHPAAEPWASVDWSADEDHDWHLAAGVHPADLLAAYEATIARVDPLIAAALADGGPDALAVKPNRRTGERFNLRWILLHMIEEYARHLGHADLLRESVDGEVGM